MCDVRVELALKIDVHPSVCYIVMHRLAEQYDRDAVFFQKYFTQSYLYILDTSLN